MKIQELRAKHPKFIYQSFSAEYQSQHLNVTFHFHVEPDIDMYPTISIPLKEQPDIATINTLIFNLGMIEAISYWKATCSPIIEVNAGQLSADQITWWQDLYLHGLGEFYYVNDIDFRDTKFLTIHSGSDAPTYDPSPHIDTEGDLIMVGGGKDSIVTLETLVGHQSPKNIILLNPTIAAKNTSLKAGFNNPLIVNRKIDPKLLELNNKGYLNGHTPFSAYLSFAGTLTAYLHGYKHLIASNESSAGEASLDFHGLPINHQYSKSYRYEQQFRDYARKHLTSNVTYFSFLRPIDELTIAKLFAKDTKYDQIFSSCNTTRNNGWCGQCAKCAFVYLILNAVMSPDRVDTIFNHQQLFEDKKIQKYLHDLTGQGGHKPLDCVGTEHESQQAVHLAIKNFRSKKLAIPGILTSIVGDIPPLKGQEIEWSEEHFLPPGYQELLRKKLDEMSL